MRIDLHCHSRFSDGDDLAEHVAAQAAEAELELFCLTDHDTCDGYPVTEGACAQVVRGLELSCSEAGRTVHLLLYDTTGDDERWQGLEGRLAELREARKDRVRAIAEKLAGLGVVIDAEALIARAGGRSIGRPDIAQALVASGAVADKREAFDRYLSDRGAAFVPLARLTMIQGLQLGQDAGAKMSLAHPHTLGEQAVELVARHRPLGLEGLEAYYGSYNHRQRRRWMALATRHHMVVTGGSDYHGASRGPNGGLGIAFPERLATALCQWLEL